ncbi:MAG: AAA family ATPase, partial [Cyclobacteriaceae bacterium]
MRDLKKIVLVGMPGSGKSTLGKNLAVQMGYRFLDLDD